MKKIILSILVLITLQLAAQENHGRTLNLGLGIGGYSGYYKYVGRSLPVLTLNYEFDVARNFTLAPFISFYSYSNDYNWVGSNYTYRETVVPVGLKGSFYFDELFQASDEWDFYAAGSLGFALVNRRWEDGYDGDKNYYRGGNPLFLDVHIGTEYHFNNKVGIFLDLSSGVSTLGLAFHGVR